MRNGILIFTDFCDEPFNVHTHTHTYKVRAVCAYCSVLNKRACTIYPCDVRAIQYRQCEFWDNDFSTQYYLTFVCVSYTVLKVFINRFLFLYRIYYIL